jgi:hypothetical protein
MLHRASALDSDCDALFAGFADHAKTAFPEKIQRWLPAADTDGPVAWTEKSAFLSR